MSKKNPKVSEFAKRRPRDAKGHFLPITNVKVTVTPVAKPKVTYIGISRDHSGSMYSLHHAAARDYNETISAIRERAIAEGQQAILSVVSCGINSRVQREIFNQPVASVASMSGHDYRTDGQTPLYDSIGDLIGMLESQDDKDPNTSFLVMAITDGEENASQRWTAAKLRQKMLELQATDRWTFVFRVPRGYRSYLTRNLGIPDGNVLEWEQTERGVQQATTATRAAFQTYFTERTRGATRSATFYVDASNLTKTQIKQNLNDISKDVKIWITATDEIIKPFCERMDNKHYIRGAAFYELTKPETVQGYKLLAIRDRKSGAVYAGAAARHLLGLPGGNIRIRPGDHAGYEIFVQSTSVNRKLAPNTRVLYYTNVGAL